MSIEQDIDVLQRQVKALRREMKFVHEHVDVWSSPLWKRLIWWCQGFYFRKVGRWYGPQTYQPPWPK